MLFLYTVSQQEPQKPPHHPIVTFVHLMLTNMIIVYTPPNAAMRGCHVYDSENGEARHVMQCAYDSVEGEVV